MSRRSALKGLGVGGATVLVAGSGSGQLPGVRERRPGRRLGQTLRRVVALAKRPGVLGAVGAAISAANPHNTQPWLFHVTASGYRPDVTVPPTPGDPTLLAQVALARGPAGSSASHDAVGALALSA